MAAVIQPSPFAACGREAAQSGGTVAAMHAVPTEVLARWPALAGAASAPFGTGLINDTFRVEGRDGPVIVQRLHPVFSPAVHHDIEAVTTHLARAGLATPRLLRTTEEALWVEHPRDDGTPGVWRAITYIPDSHTWDRVPSPAAAREAGRLVGSFHEALTTLDHTYQGRRGKGHDTARHRATLEEALRERPDHRLYDAVAPVAARALEATATLTDFEVVPARHAHGDLKISNLLFDARDRGLCLVDLDTVGRMAWAHEMGDALRSWCNPAGEDVTELRVDHARFEAAVEGYASAARVSPEEWSLLVEGLVTICRELAMRFFADALRERYFGWNPSRYPTRGDHNLVRALGQWTLAESITRDRTALEATVRRLQRT
mgnify:CR=1 FL=1